MNKLPPVFNIYEGILIEPTFLWLLAGPEASGRGVLGGGNDLCQPLGCH